MTAKYNKKAFILQKCCDKRLIVTKFAKIRKCFI